MNEFQAILAVAALFVALMARSAPRAVLWIGAGAFAFIASTWWARAGFPYSPAFAVMMDAGVCFLIYLLGQHQWEMGLYRLFLGSIPTNITYLATNWWVPTLDAHYAYVVALETINWLALALIGGAALLGWVTDHGTSPDSLVGRGLSWAKRIAFAQRKHEPFTKVP